MKNIQIYNPVPGPRSNYVFTFIFDRVLDVHWTDVADKTKLDFSENLCINYSSETIDGALQIVPNGLLSESGIGEPNIKTGMWMGLPVIFAGNAQHDVSFDIFSAVFYLITRYEEYTEKDKDQHGRFKAESSIAFQQGFLSRPVVDEWIFAFAKLIKTQNPEFSWPEREFQFQPTIDIDNAYAFIHKGLLRITGAFVRSLLRFAFKEIGLRLKVHMGRKKDPYDTYSYIKNIHRQSSLSPIIFILCSSYGPYDKNIFPKSKYFRKLVIELGSMGLVSLHPSYRSSQIGNVAFEKAILGNITGRRINSSRQHFLKITMPHTYRILAESGIENDYSMGYSSHTGFRAGTCTPFYFYDLTAERTYDMLIHPFQIIDVALRHMALSPEEAVSEIGDIISKVKAVNGLFISDWHNESLGNYKIWEGWREVYNQLIKLAVQKMK